MAKYIRLKNGHIQDVTNFLQDAVGDYYDTNLGEMTYIALQEDITKESDDLKDLFDFFVVRDDEKGELRGIFCTCDDAIMYCANEYELWTIYGATDTKKGLIYVAKLGEDERLNGEEWELI